MNQRYPVSFIKKGEYESSDFRFIDVSIDVMHTGANLNKTSFTKDAINKAVPSSLMIQRGLQDSGITP